MVTVLVFRWVAQKDLTCVEIGSRNLVLGMKYQVKLKQLRMTF